VILTDLSTVATLVIPPFFIASETVATLKILPSEVPTFDPRGLLVTATGVVIVHDANNNMPQKIVNVFFMI
jgi:hypothetical protein